MATGATRAAAMSSREQPASGKPLGNVRPENGGEETRRHQHAANRALPHGALSRRANILRRWFNLMMEHQDSDLSASMTLEQGKPLAEAKAKLATPPRLMNGSPKSVSMATCVRSHQGRRRLLVIKRPIGVTAAITPWNFPRRM